MVGKHSYIANVQKPQILDLILTMSLILLLKI